ncbi:uncharacterized protein TRUGW13939_00353 [Talaromyces rugulosus]|uniref:Mediator of RNA polymerase II transcription subunit 11 n=1 Tax=Talaromyces rugulosus TaxID=121627 RepID=A0A7H8QIL5_TALRU|nr:uncharacterized protein TRUGW13939_00353 [Talaromyces rugulosus]QKX53275.1 hypothetical protein TRUGW13939_00353 [Talaromyces rugulosus]
MDEPSDTTSQTFSSADRIRQLNDIDKDIATLVNSAGLAIKVLANDKSENNSVEERKAAFKSATSQYFALLSSIDVRLRRQVYALEEAGILDAEAVSANTGSFRGDAAGGAGAGPNAAGAAAAAAGGGAGAGQFSPLEISWLNSRKDTVGKDKEAESWAAARELVKRLQTESGQANVDKMDTD